MIRITKPRIEDSDEFNSICECDIYVDENKRTVWFKVKNNYKQYLVDDRADAYIVGLIYWAMSENHNIVCDVPITEDLLYNIRTSLIPSLVKYGHNLHNVDIQAETILPLVKSENAVGTGCSCGIDSFSAIYNHYKKDYQGLELTHLCINNVGAFNECYEDYGIEKAKQERYEIAEKVALELGLPIIATDSNFADVFKMNHLYTSTYSCCFAVYMLQKLWKTYYLASSGLDYGLFSLRDEECAHYDLLTLECFSIPGLRIYSEGGEKERYQKTEDILDFKIAQKYLHVCVNKSYNCGVCPKCRRTLITLDTLNSLEKFSDVFDLEYYKSNKMEYYKWLCNEHMQKSKMNEPLYISMLQRKKFRRVAYLYTIMWPLRCLYRKIKK